MKSVRILVAGDHEVVRRGLRQLLEEEPGWKVCDEATTGREAVKKTKALKPDIVIVDITMPELNGLDATRQILKAVPQTEVLILTIHESERLAREILAAGARAYVLKSDPGRDLVAAVRALSQHKTFVTSKAGPLLRDYYAMADMLAQEQQRSYPRLTFREREVFQLLAEGKTSKEVAKILEISTKTAEVHRTNIMNKLNLHSISELVHYAIRNNLVEP